MRIQKITILKGPNIWSNHRKKLIQMRLDLEELEFQPTDKIQGFYERIQEKIPTLYSHRCSEDHEGGFFVRVKEGTWMGHVIEHIALEIQTLAGMDCGFGRTRSTKELGVYNVVFNYLDEEAGVAAAKLSVEIAQKLIDHVDFELNDYIQPLHDIYCKNKLGPSTQNIVDAAISRNIPWKRVSKNSSLIKLGYGKFQKSIQATITSQTSYFGVENAGNKHYTKTLLNEHHIPTPQGFKIRTLEELHHALNQLTFPVVIKPLDGNQGKGATINITTSHEAEIAFLLAQKFSQEVIVEKYIKGYDHRILVINKKVVAIALRKPAHVIGDGVHTIEQLIEIENHNPLRGEGHCNVLTKISIDHDTMQVLEKQKQNLSSIPNLNEVIYLKSTSNLSTGGSSINVTDVAHPSTIQMAEKIAHIIDLDICGIDIITEDIRLPFDQTSSAVLEVNAAPGFRMHSHPMEGEPIHVGQHVIDYLFPDPQKSKIPIIAVTGTNGKTTTTRLIAHIFQHTYQNVGFTTTDGIYINQQLIEKGDTTGPISASKILFDPIVDVAVLETARGGILREGLAFDQCNIGVITNIEEDHLGLNDIETLKDLTRVKSLIFENTKPDGWLIVNADNEPSLSISQTLEGNKAYFFENSSNPLRLELEEKGIVHIYQKHHEIILFDGKAKTVLCTLDQIPIAYSGKAKFMVYNALTAILTAFVHGIKPEVIVKAISSFHPSVEYTPGRLNIFHVKDYHILVDYAHNPSGYLAIKDFLNDWKCKRKIGIISGIGDRRDQDIVKCAQIAASMFDYIIIRQEHHLRGRTEKEISSLLINGIKSIDPNIPIQLIPHEVEAFEYALKIVRKDELIVALSDEVSSVLNSLNQYLIQNKQMA
ncbi:MAG TPA: cyanophycin synthetase [Faecalibacter sp.]